MVGKLKVRVTRSDIGKSRKKKRACSGTKYKSAETISDDPEESDKSDNSKDSDDSD